MNEGEGLYEDVGRSSKEDGGLGGVYGGYWCGRCEGNGGGRKGRLWREGG